MPGSAAAAPDSTPRSIHRGPSVPTNRTSAMAVLPSGCGNGSRALMLPAARPSADSSRSARPPSLVIPAASSRRTCGPDASPRARRTPAAGARSPRAPRSPPRRCRTASSMLTWISTPGSPGTWIEPRSSRVIPSSGTSSTSHGPGRPRSGATGSSAPSRRRPRRRARPPLVVHGRVGVGVVLASLRRRRNATSTPLGRPCRPASARSSRSRPRCGPSRAASRPRGSVPARPAGPPSARSGRRAGTPPARAGRG